MLRAALNPTRDVIRTALRAGGKNWAHALPALDKWIRTGTESQGWDFLGDVARDIDVTPSPTLMTLTLRALDATDDPQEALRHVRWIIDSRDRPTLAAKVWKESRDRLMRAVLLALWAEDRARYRRACPQQLTFPFVPKWR